MAGIIELRQVKGEARVDSRILAGEMGNQHESVIKLVDDYQADFEEFGVVRFQIGKPPKGSRGGRPERFAMLNEDQAYLLLTFSRNTAKARRLKVNLVKAFARFREGQQVAADYLPLYHALHDTVKELADRAHQAGSTTSEEIFHINVNKLINRVFGLASGEREHLSPTMRAMITAAQATANETLRKALAEGLGHREAYQRAKKAMERYAAGSLALIHPKTSRRLNVPSPHAAAGRGNPNDYTAHSSTPADSGAFFMPEIRLWRAGRGTLRRGRCPCMPVFHPRSVRRHPAVESSGDGSQSQLHGACHV
jgi:phage regulator Rha-like protein